MGELGLKPDLKLGAESSESTPTNVLEINDGGDFLEINNSEDLLEISE